MSNNEKGVSDNWNAPVEEYDINIGSVGKKKITFIGASYLFVHKVLRDMLLVGGFNDVECCVHDLREEPMNHVADLLEKISRQKNTNITVTRTLILQEALENANAVVLCITTGGLEAQQRTFEVCYKYGIRVAIGDTLGPWALARTLRSVPVVIDIVKQMEAICPDAVMLNFTNPMTTITGAMAKYSNITCFGLCHSADELFRYISTIFNVSKSDIKMNIGGVNHQSFINNLWINDIDRTSEILMKSIESEAGLEDNLLETETHDVTMQQDICKILGLFPSTGDTHLAEFYKYFFTDRAISKYGYRDKMKQNIPGRTPAGWNKFTPILNEWTYGEQPVGDLHLLTTEHAHEILWACFTGEPYTRVLNVLNKGNIINSIPEMSCVEALVTVSGNQYSGETIAFPPAVHSLIQRWTTIYDLYIKSAVEFDRDSACQALFLDPHMLEFMDIKSMFEDLLLATKPWLPDEWF